MAGTQQTLERNIVAKMECRPRPSDRVLGETPMRRPELVERGHPVSRMETCDPGTCGLDVPGDVVAVVAGRRLWRPVLWLLPVLGVHSRRHDADEDLACLGLGDGHIANLDGEVLVVEGGFHRLEVDQARCPRV
jgi:hypothetical protein